VSPTYYQDDEGIWFQDDDGDQVYVDPEDGTELYYRDATTGELEEFEPEPDDDLAGWVNAAEDTLGRRLTDQELENFVIDHEAGRPIGLTPEEGYFDVDDKSSRRDYMAERLREGEAAEMADRRELAAAVRTEFDESDEAPEGEEVEE
jgi:hypothetical protein